MPIRSSGPLTFLISALVRLGLVLAFLTAAPVLHAQSIQFEWVKTLASSHGTKLLLDSNKAVIVFGGFGGTVDFDPGPAVYNVTGYDLFTEKLEGNGNFAWVAPYLDPGTNFFESIYPAIKVDIMKNFYYTGGDSVELRPGDFVSYAWSNSSTAGTLLVRDTGTYWVQVTDTNHCKAAGVYIYKLHSDGKTLMTGKVMKLE